MRRLGRRRAWRTAAMVAAVGLFGAAAWVWLVSSGWLAGQVRQVLVTRLEETLGRPVALGAVSGSLLRGIDLRDLVIAQPGGFSRGVAFSADRVRLRFDLWALARRPGDVVGALTGVELHVPRLAVARSASGEWNLAGLMARKNGPFGPQFHGRVVVRGGIVGYSDALDTFGGPFVTRFSGIRGTIAFEARGAIVIDLAGSGADGAQAALRGRYLPADGLYDLDVTATNGDAGHWGGYLVRFRELRWAGGRFDGKIHVLAAAGPAGETLDYSAAIRLRDAAAEYLPRHLWIRGASGPLVLDNNRVSTAGLTASAGGSPLEIRGDVEYPGGGWLNLAVASPRLDLAAVRTLFFPGARLGLAGEASGDVWITGPVASPYLDGDVTSASGRLNQSAFADLRTRFQYGGGVLAVQGLSARTAGGEVAGNGMLDVSGRGDSFAFAATATDVDLGALSAAGVRAVPAEMDGRASGTLVGVAAGGRTEVLAAVRIPAGTMRGLPFRDLRTLFWDDGGALDLAFASARLGPMTVYASGHVTPGGALDLPVDAFNVPLDRVAGWTGLSGAGAPAFALSGTAEVLGRLGGTAAEPVLSGAVTAWHGRVGPVPFALAQGNIRAGSRAVGSSGLDLWDGVAHYHVNGRVAFHPLAAEGLDVTAEEVPAAALARGLAAGAGISGMLSGHVRADGPLARPALSGHLTLTGGSIAGQPVDRVAARFAGDGRRVRLDSLTAAVNGSRLDASGTIDLAGPLDVHVSADQVRLADVRSLGGLGFVPAGTVSLSGDLIGTVRDPELRGTLSSPDLSINGQRFRASGAVDYRDHVLRVSPLELAQGDARYAATGELHLGPRPTADLTFDVRHGQIATILAAAQAASPISLGGEIDGTVTLTGALDDPAAHVTLAMHGGQVNGVPIGTGNADLVLRHGVVDVNTLELHPNRGSLAARGTVELRGNSAVEVSGRDLDPNVLRPVLRLQQPLTGTFGFTMQWSGPTRDPTAGLSLEATGAGISGAVADRIAALAYYKDGVVHIEDAVVEKADHKVVIQGTLPVLPGALALDPHGPLDLHLSLEDTDLSFLSLLTPEIQDGAGTVTGQVTVGGTVGDPEMAGLVQSHGGRFRIVPLGTPVENVNADIAFSQSEVLVRDLSAAVGGGQIDTHGSITVKNLRPDTVLLALTARGVQADIPGLYAGGLDAALSLSGPIGQPTLAGTVTLSHGRVALATGIAPGRLAGLPRVRLDVALDVGADVAYAQGPVRVPFGGALRLGGTLGAPTLSGTIKSLGGTVVILGTPFAIVEGQAVFSPASGLDPRVLVRAQAAYGETRVFLDINGVLPHPVLTWTSEPPLTQDQILALVGGSTGPNGSPAGLVSQVLLGSLGQALQQALHLDEFTISYDTQNPLTLRIGKFIVSNVYLSVAEVIGRSAPGTLPQFGEFIPLNPTGQPYTVFGLQYFLSPTVYIAYNVNSLGDNGVLLLARVPF